MFLGDVVIHSLLSDPKNARELNINYSLKRVEKSLSREEQLVSYGLAGTEAQDQFLVALRTNVDRILAKDDSELMRLLRERPTPKAQVKGKIEPEVHDKKKPIKKVFTKYKINTQMFKRAAKPGVHIKRTKIDVSKLSRNQITHSANSAAKSKGEKSKFDLNGGRTSNSAAKSKGEKSKFDLNGGRTSNSATVSTVQQGSSDDVLDLNGGLTANSAAKSAGENDEYLSGGQTANSAVTSSGENDEYLSGGRTSNSAVTSSGENDEYLSGGQTANSAV
eukprot:gene28716-35624_t